MHIRQPVTEGRFGARKAHGADFTKWPAENALLKMCGEVLREHVAKQHKPADNTPDLFTVPIHCTMSDGRNFTVNVPASQAGETVRKMVAIVAS